MDNNGNWTSDKFTQYNNVRLVADAKHFPEKGERGQQGYQSAATFLTFVDGTKNGVDIFIDAKVMRGAEKAGGLKKGQEVTVTGTVEFSLDKTGKLRGKIWDAKLSLGYAVRQALTEAAAPPPAEAPVAEDIASAFD